MDERKIWSLCCGLSLSLSLSLSLAMLSSKSYPISCNFPSLPETQHLKFQLQLLPKAPTHRTTITLGSKSLNRRTNLSFTPPIPSFGRTSLYQICRSSVDRQDPEAELPTLQNSGDGQRGNNWTTSVLLFGLWVALMFYVFQLTPNQTPYRDTYFLQKLLNLRGDDGFEMNQVLVAVWYIMGLWPLVYSMLLIPSGRSSKSKVPVWPFLVLSCFGGAYALIPYFVLWKPPPPPVGEDEINRWPLNFLESKIIAGVLLTAGLGLAVYAGLANGDVWAEFYQYSRESKFIHITCLDLLLLSAFAPFWVYNDMTARRWTEKASWFLPMALIPFVGPALYLLLRPPLSALPMSAPATPSETE